MAEPTARVQADAQQGDARRRAEPGPVVQQSGTDLAAVVHRSGAGAAAPPTGPDLLRLQGLAGNRAVGRLPALSEPGLVQRRVEIGPGPKNAFVKKPAILGRLRDTQPVRGPEIQQKVMDILEEAGVDDSEEIRDFFRDLGPILETAAELFARKDYDRAFGSWNEALDSSLEMILPIATARGLIARMTEAFEQAKAGAAVTAGPMLAYAEQQFDQAITTANRKGLSFADWARALALAQVQITELRHANKPKPKVEADAWQQKTSKGAKQQEARMEVSIAERVRAIDGYGGAPENISVQFNQFVNAMETQSVPSVPSIVHKYRTKGDREKGQFSVEVRIPLLVHWVIHAHCDSATGETAAGKNAMHYKRLSDRFALGASIALTPRQETMLLPAPADRLAYTFDTT